MKIAFRIECPHCHWGHAWNDNYVNAGWVKLQCTHCELPFVTKIAVTGVRVETRATIPEGAPGNAT